VPTPRRAQDSLMISRFFIDRPIFATVLSVVITLVGGIALAFLPIAQYPRITPPGVQVAISYPGASAKTIADTVAAPIEQQVNGVEGMMYMSSLSGNDGSYTLSVTFDVSVDLNTALVMVQNRVALAMPLLPTPVQNQGITIRKKTPDMLMIVNFYSPGGRFNDVHLSNFALINVKDELLRVDGVSDVSIMGERDYSIRAWLDPQKIAARNMTAGDVANAIRAQNIEAALGVVGQPPVGKTQAFQVPIDTLGRLADPEQFGNIIIKVGGTNSVAAPPRLSTGAARGSGLPTPAPDPLQGAVVQKPATTTSSSSSATTSSDMASYANSGVTGGATSTGGGTTGGGATSTGGGTTAGGSTSSGTTSANGSTGADTSTGDLAINTSATANSVGIGTSLMGNGTISATSAGRGTHIPAPAIVRLRDVARVELGALNYNQSCTFDGKPAVGCGVYQLPGTNALDVANRVRAKMKELRKHFPDGIEYTIGYDTTPFISESIDEVFNTLRDAVILVALVVLFFLQDWRAMILPLIDVPVSLIGTFAVMAAMGYSLNNISLFGLVLAIGIVVDDAIVVLENIERQMAKGFDTRTATIKAMEEISGPILAITLVLCAVFVPCAFISGITGRFFRQFAVTIAASTVISAINALTMTPSRALVIFRKDEGGKMKDEGKAATDPAHPSSFIPHPSKQALPWWSFALLGMVTLRFLPRLIAEPFDLPMPVSSEQAADLDLAWWQAWGISAMYFAPGMLIGLVIGWLFIRPINYVLGALFRAFNWGFDRMTGFYGWTVGVGLRLCVIVLILYGGLLVLTFWVFSRAPTGFVPQQDMGRLLVAIQLPDSASLVRTQAVLAHVDKIIRDTEGVAHTIGISGIAFVQQSNGPNFASLFVILDPFKHRQQPHLKDEAIMAKLRKRWAQEVKEAKVVVFGSSPIPGLSVAGGLKVIVEDRGGIGLPTLQDRSEKLIRRMLGDSYMVTQQSLAALRKAGVPDQVVEKLEPLEDQLFNSVQFRGKLAETLSPAELQPHETMLMSLSRRAELGLKDVTTQFRSNTPQLFMDIDRTKAASLGVSLDDINQTLQIYLGSLYVNSFNEFGRHWQVTLQAEGAFRTDIPKVHLLQVRNQSGQMVLLGTLVTMREISGPIFVQRYNLYTAAPITGSLLPGVSSGPVIAGVNQLADTTLPRSMKAEWTELMYMQIREGNTTLIVFGLAVICVFLALSALYESWTLPLAVILVVPLCVLSSVAGVLWTNQSVNIFVQIGLVVLVGLACKNAILVVEFAKQLHDEGMSRYQATMTASRLRLRPILMTSFAFILGVLPLVFANGAGAEMRRSLGTAVFSGMIGVTMFGIFLTPVFFYVIQSVDEAPMFTRHATRWTVSCVLGGLVGLAGGFLLAQNGSVDLVWGLGVGASGGALATLGVLGVHEAIRRAAPRPAADTPRG
jgi:multidrug efflux pump